MFAHLPAVFSPTHKTNAGDFIMVANDIAYDDFGCVRNEAELCKLNAGEWERFLLNEAGYMRIATGTQMTLL